MHSVRKYEPVRKPPSVFRVRFHISINYYKYVASLASLAHATSPLFAYATIPAPNSSLWRLLLTAIASASAAAPRLHRSASNCYFPFPSASAALSPRFQQLPDCVRFDCCSPIAFACSLTCSGRFQPMPNVLELSS